jgi:hypothetical protein
MKKLKYTDFMDALDEYETACVNLVEKSSAPLWNVTEADREKKRLAKLKCLQIVHELMK